jgi:hypothetical protein
MITVDVINVSHLKSNYWEDRSAVIYVGRSGWPTKELGIARVLELANPFKVDEHGHGVAIYKYAEQLVDKLRGRDAQTLAGLSTLARHSIKHGKLLVGCHCAPKPCHAETIAMVVAGGLRRAGNEVPNRRSFSFTGSEQTPAATKAVADTRELVAAYLLERDRAFVDRATINSELKHIPERESMGFGR